MITSAFILLTVVQAISSDEEIVVPKHCFDPPPGVNPFACCHMNGWFEPEELSKCGITDLDPNRRLESNECYYPACLLKNRRLLNEDSTLNYERMGAYLDNWGKYYPHLGEATQIAKRACLRPEGPPKLYGPLDIETNDHCFFDKMFFCLRSYVLWNCKLNEATQSCMTMKANMEECRPYLFPDL
ncbi:uncharacterized protein LOC142976040 [Anticarsia gemmatalis]|uniref:uncharacterized protein LOC142976040 n=1 Tax=Anticarsia gemmatalis TaxID=129554 RepID=UPI003F7575E7